MPPETKRLAADVRSTMFRIICHMEYLIIGVDANLIKAQGRLSAARLRARLIEGGHRALAPTERRTPCLPTT
jgi:hypothetical protein